MIFRIQKLSLLFLILLISISTILITDKSFTYAQTPTDSPTPTPTSTQSSNLEKLQKEIAELQNKVSELQKQKNTLSSQIGVMDSQIKLTQLRINATKQEITEITKDIETTSKKISKLEDYLSQITKILLKRIVATYEVGTIQPFHILLASNSVSDFFSRLNYLKIAQEHDRRLIFETQQTKNDYANQKEIFEEKKAKVESLKKQLENYTAQLDREKKDKENLLTVTKNSEAEYQKRLADALREFRQIQKAAQFLITTAPRKVAKEEIIGLMGNTGYSFGAHLHFGVYNISSLEQYDYYSNSENPANILQAQVVDWQTECEGDPKGAVSTGTGSFTWPMSTNGLRISQGYGRTCYSDVYYKGNPHPAFDMYNNSEIAIKAAEEGQAYVCRNCTGDGGNGVFIFHPSGKMSLYWHLQ